MQARLFVPLAAVALLGCDNVDNIDSFDSVRAAIESPWVDPQVLLDAAGIAETPDIACASQGIRIFGEEGDPPQAFLVAVRRAGFDSLPASPPQAAAIYFNKDDNEASGWSFHGGGPYDVQKWDTFAEDVRGGSATAYETHTLHLSGETNNPRNYKKLLIDRVTDKDGATTSHARWLYSPALSEDGGFRVFEKLGQLRCPIWNL